MNGENPARDSDLDCGGRRDDASLFAVSADMVSPLNEAECCKPNLTDSLPSLRTRSHHIASYYLLTLQLAKAENTVCHCG